MVSVQYIFLRIYILISWLFKTTSGLREGSQKQIVSTCRDHGGRERQQTFNFVYIAFNQLLICNTHQNRKNLNLWIRIEPVTEEVVFVYFYLTQKPDIYHSICLNRLGFYVEILYYCDSTYRANVMLFCMLSLKCSSVLEYKNFKH